MQNDPPEPSPQPTPPATTQPPSPALAVAPGLVGPGMVFGPPGLFPVPLGPPGAAAFAVTQQIQLWQSPYPPPEVVREYEQILTGAFDRMMHMAEHAQAAQLENARAAQRQLADDTRRGHWIAGGALLLAMGGAMGCAYLGERVIGITFLSLPVIALIHRFLPGRAPLAVPAIGVPASPKAPIDRTKS